jgi:hypothetical protein
MADLNATLAYQFQQLEARLETAMAAQLSLDLERDYTQLSLDLAQEREQIQQHDQGMGY